LSAPFHPTAWFWLVAWLMLAPGTALALDAQRSLWQLHHSRWTARDGAPTGIRKISQTTDGWLWLGSTSGLYRFDGVRFERYAPPQDPEFGTRSVSTLAAGPEGELWVGLLDGGIARVDRQGGLTTFDLPADLPTLQTAKLAALAGGRAWAVVAGQLLEFNGQGWQHPAARAEAPPTPAQGLHTDRHGDLWVAANDRWWRLDPARQQFVDMLRGVPAGRAIRVSGGRSWVITRDRLHPLPESGLPASQPVPQRDSSAIWIDHQNNLWSAYCPAGLCRSHLPPGWSDGGKTAVLPPVDESFTRQDGLTSDIGMTILEDHDGNLWVATQTGLDRFRDTLLARYSPSSAATNYLLQPYRVIGPAGGLQQRLLLSAVDATHGSMLWRWDAVEGFRRLSWPKEHDRIRALHRDAAGREWVGSNSGLWQLPASEDRSRAGRLPTPVGAEVQAQCRQLNSNRHGLWALFPSTGLKLWRDGAWQPLPFPGLEAQRPSTFALEGDTAVWTGYTNNRVLRTDAQGSRLYDTTQGLAVGAVTFLLSGRHVVVSGERGLQLLVQGRFHTPRSTQPEALRGVTGATETAAGDLWLNGVRGAVLISRQELRRLQEDPQAVLQLQLFDVSDGYPAGATALGPQSSVVGSGMGRLWFAGLEGIASLDLDHLPPPQVGPAVQWLAVAADQHWQAYQDNLRLPPGTQTVTVRFTALELGAPERVRFEARLDGVDQDWRPLGSQRELSYSHLPPGRHRLQVRAMLANGQPGPAQAPATLQVVLLPTLTQTLWFKALTVLTAMALLATALRWRLRVIARRAHELLRIRMDERERIAQQVNDTLLQGLHGLTLHFQKVANRMSETDPNRGLMNTALDRADQLILLGREQVSQLREVALPQQQDLALVLSHFGERLAAAHTRRFLMEVEGTPRVLRSSAQQHLQVLGQEALSNAFTHAKARNIRMLLLYRWWGLRLEVIDDGIGMRTEELAQGRLGGVGTGGLARIRDRAHQLGARLRFESRPHSGTRMTLRVSARHVYEGPWPRMPRTRAEVLTDH
jgi:signal transduction histidine kinase/ligand-binding sensor domain-containing protein